MNTSDELGSGSFRDSPTPFGDYVFLKPIKDFEIFGQVFKLALEQGLPNIVCDVIL